MFIEELGWNAYFDAIWHAEGRTGLAPARVVEQQRGAWRVAGNFPERWAEASGRLRAQAEVGGDWPAVGDWVAVENCTGGPPAVIQQVLQRRTLFSRKEAGKKIAEQVLAANIDKAIVVAALDGDFNARRIERYVAQSWESGPSPVVVLNKADACEAPQEYVNAIADVAGKVPVFVLSATSGEGMESFEASLAKGQTVVFLGSSGVGKSTLVNRLLRESRQSTQPVRDSDSRGRHTTTARQLFLLPSGAMVIDTPGLRELQLWDADDGILQAFAEIEELAAKCKFRDCSHETEPGCAVLAALESGELDTARLDNLRKLEREQEFLERKRSSQKQQEYKNRIKILLRAVRRDAQSREKK